MENAESPRGKEDELHKSKSPPTKQPNTMPKLMIKIPLEILSERQRKLLVPKPKSPDVPSTSMEKKDDEFVFKIPTVPPLRRKNVSPLKASSGIPWSYLPESMVEPIKGASLEDSSAHVDRIMDAFLEESTVLKKAKVTFMEDSKQVVEKAQNVPVKDSKTVTEKVQDIIVKYSTTVIEKAQHTTVKDSTTVIEKAQHTTVKNSTTVTEKVQHTTAKNSTTVTEKADDTTAKNTTMVERAQDEPDNASSVALITIPDAPLEE